MTQQEFAAQVAELKAQSQKIHRQIVELRKQYIQENAPYKIGDKVKVEFAERCGQPKTVEYGFVKEINVEDDGKFIPDLYAMKKDGTAHKNKHLWVKFYKSTITLAEEQ